MSNSLSEWLALREAADWAARSELLVDRVREVLAPIDTVHALDLCTGTGSNLRYLMDRLPKPQRWLAIDRDAALLEELPAKLTPWARARGCSVHTGGPATYVRCDRIDSVIETRQMNLERLDAAIFEGRHLVSASALLDLVSESWLRVLATRCHAAGAAALFAVTYNGGSSCDPAEPEDEMVRELMNLHQRTDKGLGGPAAGPDAAAVTKRVFEDAGFEVQPAVSDWSLGPPDRAFQRMLIEGWAHAATEISPKHTDVVADWLRRRLEHVEAGRSSVIVNHDDLLAVRRPPR
jgi:hypothetical protein